MYETGSASLLMNISQQGRPRKLYSTNIIAQSPLIFDRSILRQRTL